MGCRPHRLSVRGYGLRRRATRPARTPDPSNSAPASVAIRAIPPVLGNAAASSSAPAVAGLVAVAGVVAVAPSSSSSFWARVAGAKRASASRDSITRIGTLVFMGHLLSPDFGSRGLHLLIPIRLRRAREATISLRLDLPHVGREPRYNVL